jgi:hypothetical protein
MQKSVMKKSGRYDTSGMIEDQYEEGSDGLVLKNIPMEKVFSDVILKTLKLYGGK